MYSFELLVTLYWCEEDNYFRSSWPDPVFLVLRVVQVGMINDLFHLVEDIRMRYGGTWARAPEHNPFTFHKYAILQPTLHLWL